MNLICINEPQEEPVAVELEARPEASAAEGRHFTAVEGGVAEETQRERPSPSVDAMQENENNMKQRSRSKKAKQPSDGPPNLLKRRRSTRLNIIKTVTGLASSGKTTVEELTAIRIRTGEKQDVSNSVKKARGPCTASLLNKIGFFAFLFSAWINVCSLIIIGQGNYYAPSLMMFAYLLMVVVLVTFVLQQSLFPAEDFSNILASDKKMTRELDLQLRMSMRTEVIARFTDCLTSLSFFYFEVFLSESKEHASVVEWSSPGKFCLAAFILKCLHYIPFMICHVRGLWAAKTIALDVAWWVRKLFPERVGDWMLPKTKGSKVEVLWRKEDKKLRVGTIQNVKIRDGVKYFEVVRGDGIRGGDNENNSERKSALASIVALADRASSLRQGAFQRFVPLCPPLSASRRGPVLDKAGDDASKMETKDFLGSEVIRRCIIESQGGAKFGLTEFVLYSTVAVSVLDALDASAALSYEAPISGIAFMSAVASICAGLYGIFGRRNDLKNIDAQASVKNAEEERDDCKMEELMDMKKKENVRKELELKGAQGGLTSIKAEAEDKMKNE